MKPRVVVAVALSVVISHPVFGAAPASHRAPSARHATQLRTEAVGAAKLTVRVTPLVHLSRGDARGIVTVPRHADNRILRVVLESTDYYSLSEIQLDGADAPVSHTFYWRDLPPGLYQVTVYVYGTDGLRGFTSLGRAESIS